MELSVVGWLDSLPSGGEEAEFESVGKHNPICRNVGMRRGALKELFRPSLPVYLQGRVSHIGRKKAWAVRLVA